MFMLGTILYVGLLFINAVAILNEERFLARIGWSTSQMVQANSGFQQPYDQTGYGVGPVDIGVKGRLINLIGAVRTVLRIPLIGVNLVIIGYELIWG